LTTASKQILEARVLANRVICRDHLRLTMEVEFFPPAYPGQFVHLSPCRPDKQDYRVFEGVGGPGTDWYQRICDPLLRRAFSIAGLTRTFGAIRIEIIHRVVGTATRWLKSLQVGGRLSVLGPLGNRFPIIPGKTQAWLVAGGVGLPPMLWLAEALRREARDVVAFCGAQRAELLPLTLDPKESPVKDASRAVLAAEEFRRHGVPVVVSTDDGSLGFPGHVGRALEGYHMANRVPSDGLVVYTCGPERMMEFVAEFCRVRAIECYVCVERNMACGLGTCQSCAVPIRNGSDPDGWSYRLCCTDGPIFNALDVLWKPPVVR
jgi:dihydroorotate dehydrogenase electron transfer subunit